MRHLSGEQFDKAVYMMLELMIGGPEQNMRTALNGIADLMQEDNILRKNVMSYMGKLYYLSHKADEIGHTLRHSQYQKQICNIRWGVKCALEDSQNRSETGELPETMKVYVRDMAGYFMATCNSPCLANPDEDVAGIREHLSLTMEL